MPRLLLAPFLLIALVFSLPAKAQTLIDQVPADAVMYAGWRGSSDLGPDYAGSNLEGLLKEAGLLNAMPELMGVLQQMGQDGKIGEQEAQMVGMMATLFTSAWNDGGAVYMLPPVPNGPPIPRVCVMWKRGQGDAQALRESLDTLVQILSEQVPAVAGQNDAAVYLSVAFDPGAMDFEPLSGAERFKAATKNVQADAAAMMYMDAAAWVSQVDQFVAMMKEQQPEDARPEPFVELWPKVRDATGLSGVESLAMSAGLKDKNWHTRVFLGAPAPRKGIFTLLDNKPIKPTDLTHIPKTATFVQVFSMQPSRVLDTTLTITDAIDTEITDSITRALEAVNEEIGFSLEKELIRGMGPVWTAYIDPMIAGNGFASVVLVNDLEDADSVQQALLKLSGKANEAFAEEDEVKIRFLTEAIDGVDITHLGIPFVAPAWAVHNGKLYISLYPQGIEMATAQSGKAQDSILANPGFNKAMGRFVDNPAPGKAFEQLGPVTGLSFSDLPKTAPEGYGTSLMIMQMLSGMSEMMSGEASAVRMPPVGKIMPFIEVSGGVSRVDDTGFHWHTIEPMPGSSLIGASKGMTSGAGMTAPMTVSILLPALGAARRTARVMQTTTQARGLAMANFAYSADHAGEYADDLAKLETYIGDIQYLISPRSIRGEAIPFDFKQMPADERAQLMREASSFVLVPLGDAGQLKRPQGMVMLFERPDDTDDFELTVAMADGAAMRMPQDELERVLRDQTGKSMQELIDRQEQFE